MNKIPTLLFVCLLAISSVQAEENISIFKSGDLTIHTFHGVSNSHIIETANELRVVDAQMKLSDATKLKEYILGLGKPLKQVILSHNHPDHWFGSQVLATVAPVAASENVRNDLKNGGGRYIKLMAKKLGDNMPSEVIVPSEVVGLGAQTWDGLDVIVDEYPDQESHHAIVIKLPKHGVLIGQDLVYNNMFLVASERSRNKNWLALLEKFAANEANDYQTIMVGHGKNSGPQVFQQGIEYLKALQVTLEKGMNQEQTQAAMIEQFPDKGGKQMLGISMRNLFNPH